MNIRSRFSLRTLLVLITLVGVYFACWDLTRRGLAITETEAASEYEWFGKFDHSPAPFVVSREEHGNVETSSATNPAPLRRSYHFWFFGHTIKLPYERDAGEVYIEVIPPLVEYDDLDIERDDVARSVDGVR